MPLPRALRANAALVAGMLAAVAVAAAFSSGLLPGAFRTQVLPPPGGGDLGACCGDPGPGQSCLGNVSFDQCDAMTEPDGFFLGYGSGNPAVINEQCSIACGRDQGGGGGGVSSSSSSSSSGGADLETTLRCECVQTGTVVCSPSVKNIGPEQATGIGVELDSSGNLQIASATSLLGGTMIPIQSQIGNQVIWQPSAGPLANDAVTTGSVTLVSGGQAGGGSVSLVLVASAPQDGNAANNTDIANVDPDACSGPCPYVRMKVTFNEVENAGNGNLVRQVDLLNGTTVADGIFFPLQQNGSPISDPSGSQDRPGLVIQRAANRSIRVTLHCYQAFEDHEYIDAFLDIDGGRFTTLTNVAHPNGLERYGNGRYSTWNEALSDPVRADDEVLLQNGGTRLHLVSMCDTANDAFIAQYTNTTSSSCPVPPGSGGSSESSSSSSSASSSSRSNASSSSRSSSASSQSSSSSRSSASSSSRSSSASSQSSSSSRSSASSSSRSSSASSQSSSSSGKSSSSSSRSRSPLCGNHELDAGEQCDDGNVLDGDGCSSFCEVGAEYCALSGASGGGGGGGGGGGEAGDGGGGAGAGGGGGGGGGATGSSCGDGICQTEERAQCFGNVPPNYNEIVSRWCNADCPENATLDCSNVQ